MTLLLTLGDRSFRDAFREQTALHDRKWSFFLHSGLVVSGAKRGRLRVLGGLSH